MIQLGDRAKDRISGVQGIVIAITDWLYGCARVTIQPEELHDGKPVNNQTFDWPQVELVEAGVIVSPMLGVREAADAPQVEVPPSPAASRTGGPQADPGRASDPV